jgi:hypothetical protein
MDSGPDPAHANKKKTFFSQVFSYNRYLPKKHSKLKVITILESHKTVEIKVPNSFLLLYRRIRTCNKNYGSESGPPPLRQSCEFLIFLTGNVYHTYSLNSRDQNPRTLLYCPCLIPLLYLVGSASAAASGRRPAVTHGAAACSPVAAGTAVAAAPAPLVTATPRGTACIYMRNKLLPKLTVNNRNLQCCRSGMFIPDPDFYPSRVTDQKTATKERGGKKFVVIPFFVDTNFTKLKIILCLKG